MGKVLLIGWDGADWEMINPLLDGGELPHLSKVVQSGVIGNLATLSPCLSPQRGCLRKKSVASPYGMGWDALKSYQ